MSGLIERRFLGASKAGEELLEAAFIVAGNSVLSPAIHVCGTFDALSEERQSY